MSACLISDKSEKKQQHEPFQSQSWKPEKKIQTVDFLSSNSTNTTNIRKYNLFRKLNIRPTLQVLAESMIQLYKNITANILK